MMQRLRAQNYEAISLDFDGEHGIPAGKDWAAELYRNVSICRAAIVLLSESGSLRVGVLPNPVWPRLWAKKFSLFELHPAATIPF